MTCLFEVSIPPQPLPPGSILTSPGISQSRKFWGMRVGSQNSGKPQTLTMNLLQNLWQKTQKPSSSYQMNIGYDITLGFSQE